MIDLEDDTLAYTSAVQLQKLILSGQLDVSDLIDYFFQRIHALDSTYSAFLYLNNKEKQEYIEHLKSCVNPSLLPLFGIPVVIPDSLHLKNTPMTYGSKLLQGRISSEDSTEVAHLKEAGAFILGKTNVSEFSISYETRNELISPTRNPLNLKFSPGGPAGGSGAAVRAGFAPLALASDLTGGLRLAASFCGLIGLMPTRGCLPIKYKHFLTYTDRMFFRKGIVARCIEDVALVFDLLHFHEQRRDLSSCAIDERSLVAMLEPAEHGLRIAMSEDLGYVEVDPEVRRVLQHVKAKLQYMGHYVEEIDVGFNPDCDLHMRHMLAADRASVILRLLDESHQSADLLTPYTKWILEAGDAVTGIQYSMGTVATEWMQKRMRELLYSYDMLLLPSAPSAPYPISNIHKAEMGITHEHVNQSSMLTAPFNMSGNPVLTMTGGISRAKMPIGFQLVGRLFEEARLLNLGKNYT